jgi:hypothetical protein
MSRNSPETYKSRLRQYERREQMTIWVGAGLAGLIAITAGDAFDHAPAWLKAIEITLLVIGGAFFALARVKFEWEATQLKRNIQDKTVAEDDALPQELTEWPKEAEECWSISITLVLLAGLTMIVCFWWPVINHS